MHNDLVNVTWLQTINVTRKQLDTTFSVDQLDKIIFAQNIFGQIAIVIQRRVLH